MHADRDEELEKFIEKLFDDHASGFGEFGTKGIDSYEFLLASMKLAAFSARRAREKAIEDCLARLRPADKEQMRAIEEGNNDFDRGYYTANNEIHKYISGLKSTT